MDFKIIVLSGWVLYLIIRNIILTDKIEKLNKRVRYLEERDFANLDMMKKICDYLRRKNDKC